MRKAALLLLLFCSTYMSAQNVMGVVRDSVDLIPSVIVSEGGVQLTMSDENGSFALKLDTGVHVLQFSALGYADKEVEIIVSDKFPLYKFTVIMKEETQYLSTVVISSGRYEQRTEESTVSIDVLEPNLISDRAQSEMEQTIQQASSVNVADGQVNIRSGSGWSYGAGTRVLVLLDEMPLISPDAGQAQWSLVPTEAVDQVEILKGASSSLYGASAMNGIVNVRTLRPTDNPQTDIRLYQGVYDHPRRGELRWSDGIRGWTGTQFNHTFRTGERKNRGFVVAGQIEHDAGFQYDVPDHRARLLGKYTYFNPEAPNWEYEVMATGLWSETGDALLWNGYNEAYVPLDSQATRTKGYDFIIDPKVSYSGRSGTHTLRGRFMAINNNAKSESTDYTNNSKAVYGEYMWQKRIGKLMLVSGASIQYGHSNSEVFGGVHTVNDQAVYLQADYNLEWLIVSAGLRYEGLQLDDRSWSRPVMRFGLNGGTEATRFRLTYGEGFRFPSMAETFTETNVGALKVYPNEELNPESGYSTELGIRQLFKISKVKGFIDVAAFYMRYENMMEFSFGRWGTGGATAFEEFGFRSINVGDTEIKGIEISASAQWDITRGIKLNWMGGMSWMDPKHLDPTAVYASYPLSPGSPDQDLSYESTSSNPESGVLKYRYTKLFKSDFELSWRRLSIGSSIRYNDYMQNIDQIFVDYIFTQVIPGVPEARENNLNGDWVIDTRIRFDVNDEVNVAFIVNNITNLEYYPRPSLAGPPRSFVLQLRYTLQ